MLPRLQGFASEYGADFYRLPRNQERSRCVREPWSPPASYPFGDGRAGAAARRRAIAWRLQGAPRERRAATGSPHRGRTPGPVAPPLMVRRFRGFLPVVIDVETGGFEPRTDALLQIAAVLIDIDADRPAVSRRNAFLSRAAVRELAPRSGLAAGQQDRSVASAASGDRRERRAAAHFSRRARRDPQPRLPARGAGRPQRRLRSGIPECRGDAHRHRSAIRFIRSRASIPRHWPARRWARPCWPRPCAVAGLAWDKSSAHSATYDAERTADLFCLICNELADSYARAEQRARQLGWQEPPSSSRHRNPSPKRT